MPAKGPFIGLRLHVEGAQALSKLAVHRRLCTGLHRHPFLH
jgi:hypothetical protein